MLQAYEQTRLVPRVNGDVNALGLEALLQMLGQQGTGGWLILRQGGVMRRFVIVDSHIVAVRSGSGSNTAPRSGWGAAASPDARHPRLGELLVARHEIRREILSRTLEVQRKILPTASGRRRPLLGELLLSRGEIRPAPLREALAEQLRQDVMDLLTRSDVTFEFRPGHPATDDEITRLPIMSVLMESARRIDDTRARTARPQPTRSEARVAIAIPSMEETRRMIQVLTQAGVATATFHPDARPFSTLHAFRPTVIVADGDRGPEELAVMKQQASLARARLALVMDHPGEDRILGVARLGVRTILVRPWSPLGLVERLVGGHALAGAA